jgi:hypothetical protein
MCLFFRGRRGGDDMVVGFTPMQSVPINTKVVSLNPAHGEVYSMQHFSIKFVKDLPKIDAQCNSFREEDISVFSRYGPVLIIIIRVNSIQAFI